MKIKRIVVSAIAFFAIWTGMALAGCTQPSSDTGDGSSAGTSAEAGIVLDRTSCTLEVGQTITLTADVSGYEGTVTWTVSDPSVAAVEDGKVTALKEGSAVVKAQIGEAEASCNVTVLRASEVGTLLIDYSSVDLLVGKSVEVRASVVFGGEEVSGLSFSWECENTEIVSVAAENDRAAFSGTAPGETSVTVSCVHLGETLTETISVSVRNDVSVAVENMPYEDGGYKLTLVKSEPAGYTGEEKSEFIPDFTVTADGEEVQNPEVQVEIPQAAASVVRYEEGDNKLVSVGVGEAEIAFVYETNGARYEVKAAISVILPEITEDRVFDLEISEGYSVISSDLLPENPVAVRIDGKDMTFSETDGGIRIEGYTEMEFGEYVLTAESEDFAYRANAFVLTSVIESKEELDALGKTAEKGNGIWDGYFALGNDIAYNGEFRTFCGLSHCAGWGGTTGFLGTFDGRGHIIEGLTIGADAEGRAYFGGLFGVIGISGTVKNVGFADAKITAADASGIVADIVYGTIEDVFVEVDNQGGTRCGGVARYLLGGGKMNRCVVFLSGAREAAEGDFSGSNLALVSFSANDAVIDNCYSVGALELYRTGGDIPSAGIQSDTLRKFSSYAEMKEYTFAAEDWPEDIWRSFEGVPVFASYAEYMAENVGEKAISNDASQPVSDRLDIVGSGEFVYALKEEKEGISLEGNTVLIEGNFGESFTVAATWIFDESVRTEKTFTVSEKESVPLDGLFDVDMKKEQSLLFSDAFSGNRIVSVRIGDTALQFEQDGASLTIGGYAGIPYGEKQMTIEAEEKTFTASALFATFISGTQEWDAEVAEAAAHPAEWDKYYVLTADLDYTGKDYVSPQGEQYGAVSGFKGVFDGRNHTIAGVVLRGVGKSFFGTVAIGGTIRNVAFIDCSLSSYEEDGVTFVSTNKSAVVADLLYGNVENVYLRYANDGHWWCAGIAYFVYETASVKNCFAEVTGHTGDKLHSLFVVHKEEAAVADCYAITALDMPLTCVGDDPATGSAFTERADMRTFASAEEMKEAEADLSGWDGTIWDISSGVPVLRSPLGEEI